MCVSIYVRMEFEGEERKKGRRGRRGGEEEGEERKKGRRGRRGGEEEGGGARTVTVGSSKTMCTILTKTFGTGFFDLLNLKATSQTCQMLGRWSGLGSSM